MLRSTHQAPIKYGRIAFSDRVLTLRAKPYGLGAIAFRPLALHR
jgi:hypothetical protein